MKTAPRDLRPKTCRVCAHPERARIEMLRVGGAGLAALAKQFDVSRDSIWRHCTSHLTDRRRAELIAGPAQVEALAEVAASESRSLIDQMRVVRNVLFNQFLACAEAGDRSGVTNLSGRLLESLRELGKLTGELRQISGVTINNNTLNIFADPRFLELQAGLLAIARTHPDARGDIVALLRGLDAKTETPKLSGPPTIECEAIDAA